MNTNKYYFPNSFEDNNLKLLAVRVKDMFEKYKYAVQIFDVNNNELQGNSPGQTLFLMKLNNKTIFKSSPSSESIPTDSKSYRGLSNPSTRNAETLNAVSRCLPLNDAENKGHHSATFNTSSPISQTVIVNLGNQLILNPTAKETDSKHEQFIQYTVFSQSPVAGHHESPPSAEAVKVTVNFSKAEKELQSPAIVVVNFNQGNQESPKYAEITKMASSPAVDDKISRSLNQNDPMVVDSARSKDSPNSMENYEKSDKSDSPNKDSICHTEEIGKDFKPTGNSTSSPAKRSDVGNSSTFVIQKLDWSSVKVRMVDNSSGDTEVNLIPFLDDKMNKSPNEPIEGISSDVRKRKYLPTEKRWILNEIQLDGKTEVEAPCDSEDIANLTTFKSSISDHSKDSKKDNTVNHIVSELRTKSPSRSFEWTIPSPETSISTVNVSTANSPNSDDSYSEKYPPDTLSLAAPKTSEMSYESEDSSADIDVGLNQSLIRFNSLLSLRNRTMERKLSFNLKFQNGINFLNDYIQDIRHIVRVNEVLDKNYFTEELKEIINVAKAMAMKLENKLKTLSTECDTEVDNFQKYLRQYKEMKEKYELFTIQSKPSITAEALEVYECEIKAIWTKMDEMIMLRDSKKDLLSEMANDFEKLMRKLIKCFVLVGILLNR